ncbi:MAG: pentapeptide repeat-containing protein, partial [Phycisphaerales bacterium]
MSEPNSQSGKPIDERRYDPELLKKRLRCDLDQYEMLKRCSDKKNMTEWNEWRKNSPSVEILLEGANLVSRVATEEEISARSNTFEVVIYLTGTRIIVNRLHLKRVNLSEAYLSNARLLGVDLEGADLTSAHLENADFSGARLIGTKLKRASVNENTLLWECGVGTNVDIRGVSLDSVRIYPATKQLLEYNLRRMNWEAWYKYRKWQDNEDERNIVIQGLMLFVRLFWSFSDYGLSTWRIILWFFGLAFGFALVYWLWPSSVMVNGTIGDIRGLWHALYFSVVTMTTLGFADIAANPDSWLGQTLLMIQVFLGYV